MRGLAAAGEELALIRSAVSRQVSALENLPGIVAPLTNSQSGERFEKKCPARIEMRNIVLAGFRLVALTEADRQRIITARIGISIGHTAKMFDYVDMRFERRRPGWIEMLRADADDYLLSCGSVQNVGHSKGLALVLAQSYRGAAVFH